jgi:hypothetical protein
VSSLSALLVAAMVAGASASELADPTLPPAHAASQTQAPALQLQAILHSRDRDVAVIDGKRVEAGDSIGAWRVVEVRRDAVRLRGDRRELELRLAPEVRRAATIRGGEP